MVDIHTNIETLSEKKRKLDQESEHCRNVLNEGNKRLKKAITESDMLRISCSQKIIETSSQELDVIEKQKIDIDIEIASLAWVTK